MWLHPAELIFTALWTTSIAAKLSWHEYLATSTVLKLQ